MKESTVQKGECSCLEDNKLSQALCRKHGNNDSVPTEEKWKEDLSSKCPWMYKGVKFNIVVKFIENLLEQERAERDNFWAKNEESRLKNYEALGYHKGKMAERKRMSEVLTVNLDMSQMLDGWDKYWIDAKNGRYIEGCAECGNSKRIKESIINK